jgi:outer membrane protein assembly factor BamB
MPGRFPYDDMVYAGSDDGHVYALDTVTGQPSWTYTLRGPVSSGLAQAAPAGVYAGDERGNLYALNADTGADPLSDWRHPLGGAVRGALAIKQDTLYAGTADGTVYAVNIYNNPLWSYPAGSPVTSGLAVSGGTLYAGSEDGYLHAINVSTGTQRWRYRTGGAVRSQILVTGGVVYFGSLDGSVYAVRA